jgi:hypothetical protein
MNMEAVSQRHSTLENNGTRVFQLDRENIRYGGDDNERCKGMGKASTGFASSRSRSTFIKVVCVTCTRASLMRRDGLTCCNTRSDMVNRLFPVRERWCSRATNASRRGLPCRCRLRRRHKIESLVSIRSRIRVIDFDEIV